METYHKNADFTAAVGRLKTLIEEVNALIPELRAAAPDAVCGDAISRFARELQAFNEAMEDGRPGAIADDDPDTDPPTLIDEDVTVVTTADEPEENPQPGPKADIRPLVRVFTINDRYRFRRELFGNLDAAMAEALETLALMPGIDQARAYLEDDLCWDMSVPEVEEFIAAIQPYYNHRRP